MHQRITTIGMGIALLALSLLPLGLLAGSGWRSSGTVDLVWGRRGVSDGRFLKPRAVAIDDQDQLYIVDMTARIQVFDREGNFLRSWRTPAWENGKPTGLSMDRNGNLMVADTHYYRVLFYAPNGELLEDRTIGGEAGRGPGQFGLVTDAVQDSQGNIYVSEYGDYDRIQKFNSEGQYLFEWGGHGSEPGQFVRPQNMAVDKNDLIWVVDACNHRIQVFDATGDSAKLLRCFGKEGSDAGDFRYPYDIWLDGKGHLYVCEFGNHRVQKLTTDGKPLQVWGASGREMGMTHNPWGLVQDGRRRLHVLDTYNHRVQRVRL